MMKKGQKLSRGDTIGLIAPASPASKEEIRQAVNGLKQQGFNVIVGKSCYAKYGGYLSGDRYLRVNDLHEMFSNPHINGIMCLRGGYGTSHLLPLIDYELIKRCPKVFVGFSDITALHIALIQKANLVTFHGPTMSRGLHNFSKRTKQFFLRSVTLATPVGEILNEADEQPIQSLTRGVAKGNIVGGNLSLISATMGTPFEIDTKDKILFIEEVNEDPYRIDRMLTQLAIAGKFADAAGIVLGTWYRCEPKDKEGYFSVTDLFDEIIKPLNKPTIYNVQSGHGPVNITLPFGVRATVDANNGRLFIDETAVESTK